MKGKKPARPPLRPPSRREPIQIKHRGVIRPGTAAKALLINSKLNRETMAKTITLTRWKHPDFLSSDLTTKRAPPQKGMLATAERSPLKPLP